MKKVIRKLFLLAFLCAMSLTGSTQTTIVMEADGGVYKISCTINGLRLKMIFDPGASNVCISESVANMMLENDYLSISDIKGKSQSQVADGRIVDHTIINLRKVQLGDKVLTNVEAVVIKGQDAPLLFGQSALKKLGGYSISGNKLKIGINNPSLQSGEPVLKEEDVARIFAEARDAMSSGLYRVAIEKYKELYDYDLLEIPSVLLYAQCLLYSDEFEDAIELLLTIQHNVETEYLGHRTWLYNMLGRCYEKIGEYNDALLNYEKCKYFENTKGKVDAVISIAHVYWLQGNFYKSRKVLDEYIYEYLHENQINATDCWSYSSKATSGDIENLGLLYYNKAISYESYNDDVEKYMIIAAAWGNEDAIEWCNKYDVYFRTKPYKYQY